MKNQIKPYFNMKPIFKGAMVLTTILLIIGGVLLYRTLTFVSRAVETTGIVTNVKTESSGDTTMYYPTFAFKDEKGKDHVVEPKLGTSESKFRKGRSVRILYDPQEPTHVRVNSFQSIWLATVIIDVIAVSFVFFTYVLWRTSQELEKKQRDSMKSSD